MSATRTASQLSLENPHGNVYLSTICAFFIEVLLLSPLYSFGVLHLKLSENEAFDGSCLSWSPIFLLISWKITNPWSKELCDFLENDFRLQKWLIFGASTGMAVAILLSGFITNTWLFSVVYGCLSGIAISIIEAQIKVSTYEDFQSRPRVIEGLRQLARAAGLFLMPHLLFQLLCFYDIQSTILIYSAILLNILPLGLILTRTKESNISNGLNKYRTCSGLLDDPNIIELSPIHRRFLPYNPEENSYSNTLESMFNNEDDFEYEVYEQDNKEINGQNGRNKTAMGVEIMPKIEEVSEDEIEEEPRCSPFGRSIKRYSKVGEKLEEAIAKNKSGDILISVNNLETASQSSRRGRKEMKFSKYFKNVKRKIRHFSFKDTFKEHVTKPLWFSLKTFYFYPSLYTKSTVGLMTVIYLVTIPTLAMKNSENLEDKSYTQLEAVFLLSIISFSWLFFLISLIWILNMSELRIRIINILGLFLCSACFYLVSKFRSHEMITLNSLLFGFAFGIIKFTEDIVFRESLGLRTSNKVEGTLDVMSGFLFLVYFLVIHFFGANMQELFSAFSVVCFSNIPIWGILPISHFLYDYFKNYEQRGSLIN